MTNNTRQLVKETLEEAVSRLSEQYEGSSLTDMFITVDKACGVITVYDDENNSIVEAVVPEWEKADDIADEDISTMLLGIVSEMDSEDAFATLEKYYPFSVCLADENMEVIEELLTITGGDSFQIDSDLLSTYGKQFDDFIDKLLND